MHVHTHTHTHIYIGFPSYSVKNLPAMEKTQEETSWVRKILLRKDRLPTPVFLGFPCGSAGKESSCNVGDLGSIPGLERSPGEDFTSLSHIGQAFPPEI